MRFCIKWSHFGFLLFLSRPPPLFSWPRHKWLWYHSTVAIHHWHGHQQRPFPVAKQDSGVIKVIPPSSKDV